jgi:hypothetical protein
MSGGSFGYAYSHVQEFADDLENKLKVAAEAEPDAEEAPVAFEPETTAKLQHIAKLARHVGALMKEVDWLYSGDNGEESFARNLQKLPQLEFQNANISKVPDENS